MPIEDRTGTCRTCSGPARRIPNRIADLPDGWIHERVSDWRHNPHDVDPIPTTPQEDSTP